MRSQSPSEQPRGGSRHPLGGVAHRETVGLEEVQGGGRDELRGEDVQRHAAGVGARRADRAVGAIDDEERLLLPGQVEVAALVLAEIDRAILQVAIVVPVLAQVAPQADHDAVVGVTQVGDAAAGFAGHQTT